MNPLLTLAALLVVLAGFLLMRQMSFWLLKPIGLVIAGIGWFGVALALLQVLEQEPKGLSLTVALIFVALLTVVTAFMSRPSQNDVPPHVGSRVAGGVIFAERITEYDEAIKASLMAYLQGERHQVHRIDVVNAIQSHAPNVIVAQVIVDYDDIKNRKMEVWFDKVTQRVMV